jgi:hypothetical protein
MKLPHSTVSILRRQLQIGAVGHACQPVLALHTAPSHRPDELSNQNEQKKILCVQKSAVVFENSKVNSRTGAQKLI